MPKDWFVNSWQQKEINQQPIWNDQFLLNNVLNELRELPALVFSGETRELQDELKKVNEGTSFVLQAGNCAESFDECNGPEIHNYMRIMAAMKDIIEKQTSTNVISIGRVAGQFAKPRSNETELINGIELPVYRGDNVNSINANIKDRTPDPNRLLKGYFCSVATLNLIRAFVQGRYSESSYRLDWQSFPYSDKIKMSPAYLDYLKRLDGINDSGDFKNFFISHEALLLNYEEAFTREDTIKGGYYNTAAHFLWIGDRTRDINSSHIEYARGIGNPIGIKVGPNANPSEISNIIQILNPYNEDGKIVLIYRFGKDQISTKLPQMLEMIRQNKLNVINMIDPMHGNTFNTEGVKVRSFEEIIEEVGLFFNLCRSAEAVPGGIHLEITSKLVTECIGGTNGIQKGDLKLNYLSKVDPRLNGAQAIELSIKISDFF